MCVKEKLQEINEKLSGLMIRDQTYRADNGKWKLWQKEMDKKVD
jgi:hypothetical protein